MKNLIKLGTFILLLWSFVFTTTSIVFADEKKAEGATATDAEKSNEAEKDGKAGEKDKKKKSKDDEEPECE